MEMLSCREGRERLHSLLRLQSPPYVTGAYIVKTPNGMDKLAGVWHCIEQFATVRSAWPESVGRRVSETWLSVAKDMLEAPQHWSLERAWRWLLPQDHMGPFMAYEVVSDLRHTALLDRAPDIMTWANAGPGAMRGLNRIHDRDLYYARRSHPWVEEMRELLEISRDGRHWPPVSESWPIMEMREIEHTLCEWDKYMRVARGEGRPRGTYP